MSLKLRHFCQRRETRNLGSIYSPQPHIDFIIHRSQRPLNQPMVPVAVASPKSPLGSAASSSSYDLKSPTSPEVLLDLNPNLHHGIHHRQGSAPSAAVR